MTLIKFAIQRPLAVVAIVVMSIIFGAVALQSIPIQLAPDVSKPEISVATNWPGASSVDVEREIINTQQDVLKGLENLDKMTAQAADGRARITLTFALGTDMDKALLLTANRLDRISNYPVEANQPTLSTTGSEDNPIAWFRLVFLTENSDQNIRSYRDFAEDTIKERIERIAGVGEVNIFGGRPEEMQIEIDPFRMAQYGLTVSAIVNKLRQANFANTAGDIAEGKRRYIVRTDNAFKTKAQILETVLLSRQDPITNRIARVRLGDVATVNYAYPKATAKIRSNGNPAIAINVTRDVGANVMAVMAEVRRAVTTLNEGVLKTNGLNLQQIYDETLYIQSAIDLVVQNIYWGGGLAALILLIFLRSIRGTLVVVMAIPVSVIASFVAMAVLGRSLNVVSLAGIAFAVGMVVDAAIVVLENIDRLRQKGMPAMEAAYRGAAQVWGAVFVSALTTVMVFIPILIMELEVGQLFRDIAVALSVSVLLSLLVSITVIPALANRLLRKTGGHGPTTKLRIPLLDWFGGLVQAGVKRWAIFLTQHQAIALIMVGVVAISTIWASSYFLPKLEYLPEGNRNFLFGIVFPPPGYNLKTMTEIASRVESQVKPYWANAPSQKSAPAPKSGQAPKSATADSPATDTKPPQIDNFFFVASPSRTFIGASAVDADRAAELLPLLNRSLFVEPGTFGFFTQPSIFGRGVGGSRAIDVDIQGADLNQIISFARQVAKKIETVLPRRAGNQLRPLPGLELGAPELRITPNPLLLADNGVEIRDLGLTIDAYNDGLLVDEITSKGKLMDLVLRGKERPDDQTQAIGNFPIITQSGVIVPLAALSDIAFTAGPTEIRHKNRIRTVTLVVRPNSDIALQDALTLIQQQVIDPLEKAGLPDGIGLRLSGTADKLQQTWQALKLDLVLAIVIVFLVMAILFESFLYPLIIIVAVPLATAGGILGLSVLNLYQYQTLDMLTLLGFVILVGIVVNNAILIIHQSLFHIRHDKMSINDAVIEATCNRVRPIFMSTLSSVFGMLPLVIFPGAGSEIYRGLGSVIIGGLSLSAVMTIFVVPPLMRLFAGLFETTPAK